MYERLPDDTTRWPSYSACQRHGDGYASATRHQRGARASQCCVHDDGTPEQGAQRCDVARSVDVLARSGTNFKARESETILHNPLAMATSILHKNIVRSEGVPNPGVAVTDTMRTRDVTRRWFYAMGKHRSERRQVLSQSHWAATTSLRTQSLSGKHHRDQLCAPLRPQKYERFTRDKRANTHVRRVRLPSIDGMLPESWLLSNSKSLQNPGTTPMAFSAATAHHFLQVIAWNRSNQSTKTANRPLASTDSMCRRH